MSDTKKVVKASVADMIKELEANESARFSKSDFQMLVYSVLADKDFKPKKYLVRNDEIVEQDIDIAGGMFKFLDRVLKHAGMDKADERQGVINTFEFGVRDIEWIVDAVDEASFIYTEAGKNLRMFRDKMLQLTVKKMVRTGKYDGKVTYKKTVLDRAAQLKKRQDKK